MDKKYIITIKTFAGAENVLEEELKELGYHNILILKRAVQIEGNLKDVYYLNLHLRCALSILIEIAKFRIKKEEDLYQEASKIKWSSYFDVKKTFAVKGAVFSTLFRHSQFPMLVVKDAIVDSFRKETGDRPNIEIKRPQIAIDVYIREQEVIISLNTSGTPLFQRGYRSEAGIAPLNEVTAAILIRLSGWDRKSDFMDPFCGSGTILIEAALMAYGIPSNIERQHYAFKNLINYDKELWESIYNEVKMKPEKLPFQISGSDIDSEMVLKTRRNLRIFPFGRFIDVKNRSFEEVEKTSDTGVLISNPPYGERMGDEIDELYSKMGDWFKFHMSGWNCWVISSNEEALKNIALKPTRKIKIYNGELDCSFRKYSIFDGSRKEFSISKNEDK